MKARIPSALPQRNKFIGSPTTFSTRNFFEFCPDFNKALIPETEINVDLRGFCRTLPLPVPTMGRLNVVYRAFFVPYSSIMRGFNDFITNTLHIDATNSQFTIPTCRYFSEEDFVTWLITNSLAVANPQDEHDYDFSCKVSSNVANYYKIKNFKGKRAYKIFLALGYSLTGVYSTDLTEHKLSAMPLLSLVRIYLDYYYPNQFRDNSDYLACMSIINRDTNVLKLSVQDISVIFNLLAETCYKDNIFVDSFLQPGMPNTPFESLVITDITDPAENVFGTYNSGNVTDISPKADLSKTTYLSQNTLNILQRMTQYFKRNQFAGGLAFDRMLARFGLRIYNDCSKYIDSYTLPISIGDVMSQTDNYDAQTDSGASLGSYAGKAIGADYNNGSGHFRFTAPTYGQFIIVASVIPVVGYYQGIDRDVHCLSSESMYQPEYDGLSSTVIEACELYNPHDNATNTPSDRTKGFAFVPLYYEKKTFRDKVIGDYRLFTQNSGMNAYHLLREFSDDVYGSYSAIYLTSQFVRAIDWSQYNRIFGLSAGDKNGVTPDAFRLRTEYNIVMFANMRKLYDDIDFDQLQHNSKGSSDVDISSAKLN